MVGLSGFVSPSVLAPEVLIIAGPTAVGKSSLAVEVAQRVGAEIVSADSRQVYRGLDVGTATPSEADRAAVPHHGIQTTDPGVRLTAGRFQRVAYTSITDIHNRSRGVVVAGGSTLYVHAIVAGLADLPPVPTTVESELAERLRQPGGPDAMYRQLERLDPVAAATLDPSKTRRLVRLLGVVLSTGRPASEAWSEQGAAPIPSHLIVLDRPRDDLYARIEARVDAMIEAGLVEEAQSALRRWPGARSTLEATIGYRELLPVLDGEQTLGAAVSLIKRNSRRYAKRQLTWYRRYSDAIWMDARTTTADDVLKAVAPWPLRGV